MKSVNWYLSGWQRTIVEDQNGRKREKLVYIGEYYTFGLSSLGLAWLKFAYVANTLFLLTLWLIGSFLPAKGADGILTGIPWYFCIFPFMYLLMGSACIIPIKEPMTYRAMYAAMKRIKLSCCFIVPLLALSAVGQTFYLLNSAPRPIAGAEYVWLALALSCTLLALGQLLLHRRFPPQMISAHAVKLSERNSL